MLSKAQFHGAARLSDYRHRWCWAIALTFILWSAAGVLVEVLTRFFESPTVLVRLTSNQDLVAFPCVIVCPEIDFPEAKTQAFLDQVKYPPGLNKSSLEPIMYQLAAYFALDVNYFLEDLESIQQLLDYNDINIETAVLRLMTSCNETLIKCAFRSDIVDCSTLFTVELTGDGFCCVFNGREIEESGLHKTEISLRRYTDLVGYLHGVTLAIDQRQKVNNIDLSYKWLALQGGNGYVDISINGSALSKGEEIWYGFYQSRLQLSSDARGWGKGLLRCRLEEEPLKYFPVYTWKYCLLECEIAQTLKKCGCVRPTHPRPPGVLPCPANKMQCARHASLASSSSDECNCPHACEMESDWVKLQSFKLVQNDIIYDPIYEGLDMQTVTIVRAFVLNHYSPTFNRRPIQTSLDLFSNLGGVFNVYLGISVLTSLELIALFIKSGRRCHNKMTNRRTTLSVIKPITK